MSHQKHIGTLFSTHLILLETFRQHDSNYFLEEHYMRS
jgi:hypothetical protein